MSYTAHVDSFARDNLPPREQWPEFLLHAPELQYPERLNCVHALPRPLDRGGPGRRALPHRPRRDADLCASSHERVNRIANVLVGELGLVPGDRVLLRAANNADDGRGLSSRC